MPTLVPTGTRILVQLLDANATTKSGIVLPTGASNVRRARVVAAGNGRLSEHGEVIEPGLVREGGRARYDAPAVEHVTPGTVVLLAPRAGLDVGDGTLVLDWSEVLAVEVGE